MEGWSVKAASLPPQLQERQPSSPALTERAEVGASGKKLPPSSATDGSSPGAERPSCEPENDISGPCDPTILDELRAEDESLLKELVGIFQSEATEALGKLYRALIACDCATAARIAHTLKGSAGNFGAAQLQEIAARMDQAASAGHPDEALGMYEDLCSEYSRVCRYLVAEIDH
jgi:HPt (histidine-containing phosphotransfer) domain-containing protein